MNSGLFILLAVMAFGITISVFITKWLFKTSLTFWVGIFFIIMVNFALTLNAIEFSHNEYVDRLIGLVLIIISAVGLMKVFDKLIGKSLRELTDNIDKLSEGRLDISINSKYQERKSEIGMISRSLDHMIINLNKSIYLAKMVSKGELFFDLSDLKEQSDLDMALKNMVLQLRKISGDIKGAAEQIKLGSHELSAAAQTIAQGANEQASSSEEVASTMEEMTTTNAQNSENADRTDKIAKNVAQDILAINESVAETSVAMRSIAGKISLINDIAEKTNILAINAAIEAARAGDSGRGFAVVAAEVRDLAENSQKAAEEIEQVTLSSMQKVERSKELLDNIHPEVQKTSVLVNEISAATHEQNSGISEVNSGIQQLSAVIQQNSASAEQMAANSEELSAQAAHLNQSISFFKITKEDNDLASEQQIIDEIEKLNSLLKSNTKQKELEKSPKLVRNEAYKGITIDLNDKDFESF